MFIHQPIYLRGPHTKRSRYQHGCWFTLAKVQSRGKFVCLITYNFVKYNYLMIMNCGMVTPLPLMSGEVPVTLLGEVSDAPNRMAESWVQMQHWSSIVLQLVFNKLNEKFFVVGMVTDAKEHIPERPYSWSFERCGQEGTASSCKQPSSKLLKRALAQPTLFPCHCFHIRCFQHRMSRLVAPSGMFVGKGLASLEAWRMHDPKLQVEGRGKAIQNLPSEILAGGLSKPLGKISCGLKRHPTET